MRIFGAIGLNGSGKDEVVKYLHQRYNIPFISIGDIVREMADKKGITPTRENLHRISEEYIWKHGKEYFVSLVVERIKQNEWQTAGVTGIRTPDDVRYFMEQFDDDFILFHVYVSDPHLRYERTHKRGGRRDPQSYEKFLEQDRTEESLFRISEAIQWADYSLNNDGSIEHLHHEIDRILLEQRWLIDTEEGK